MGNYTPVEKQQITHTSEKIIPILPCPDIKIQVEFYQVLRFDLLAVYTSPNPYAALQWGPIELHFYGSRKTIPAENPSMCFIRVDDVDAVCSGFTIALKEFRGKIPRSGIPRITKVRDLSSDRRFTLTDTGGNTLFIGSPVKEGSSFFRTLQNEEFAKKFAVLYDIVYSKEDHSLAFQMLPKYSGIKNLLGDLDRAKFLLVMVEIQKQLGLPVNDQELINLIEAHGNRDNDWTKVKQRHVSIVQME